MPTLREHLSRHGFILDVDMQKAHPDLECSEFCSHEPGILNALDLPLGHARNFIRIKDFCHIFRDMEDAKLEIYLMLEELATVLSALEESVKYQRLKGIAEVDLDWSEYWGDITREEAFNKALAHTSGLEPRKALEHMVEKALKELVGNPRLEEGCYLLQGFRRWEKGERRISKALWGYGTGQLIIVSATGMEEDPIRGQQTIGFHRASAAMPLGAKDTIETIEIAGSLLKSMPKITDALEAARNI